MIEPYVHGTSRMYTTKRCRCSLCRTAHADQAREYYQTENGGRLVTEWRGKRRAILLEAKSKPCADCGVQYPPYVMDFDHKGDKKFNLGGALSRSLDSLIAEIAKCDVVCSNCHRERTAVRGYRTPRRVLDKPVSNR
jgi:hypothetical protein